MSATELLGSACRSVRPSLAKRRNHRAIVVLHQHLHITRTNHLQPTHRHVVSDILGKSARAMLAALTAGQRDPKVLAELALGRLRPKVGALEQALVGRFCEHHGRLCSKMLAHIAS